VNWIIPGRRQELECKASLCPVRMSLALICTFALSLHRAEDSQFETIEIHLQQDGNVNKKAYFSR